MMRTLCLGVGLLWVGCAHAVSGPSREQLLGSWKLVQANGERRHGVVRDALRREADLVVTFDAKGTWTSTTLLTGTPACRSPRAWNLENGVLRRGGSVLERVRFSGGELVLSPDALVPSPGTGAASEGRYARTQEPAQPVCPRPAAR